MRSVVRKMLLLTAVAVVLVGFSAAIASAAVPNRPTIGFISPSPSEGATLTTNSVRSRSRTTGRRSRRGRSSAPSRGRPPRRVPATLLSHGTGSESGKSYSGLANGAYTFTVTLSLTDGGTASATRHFTIDAPVRHVYWGNGNSSTIGRANLDGTGANQSFISGATLPEGVAVDAGHVYWTNARRGHDRAGEPGRDGREPELHHRRLLPRRGGGRRRPRLLDQLGSEHDRAGEPGRDGREPELHHRRLLPRRGGGRRRPRLLDQRRQSTIGRANLDGTGVNQSFITGASCPVGVAVDAGHVYWTNRRQQHDRPGEPGRDGREPELHRRRLRPRRGGGRRRPRLLGQLRHGARSGGRTWTGRARTRTSSPAPPAPSGWRSTPASCRS